VWFPLFSKYCSTAKCFDSHGPREKTKPCQFPSAASVLGGDEGKDCEDEGKDCEDVESTAAGSETFDRWCTLCLLMKALAEMKDQSRCKLCDSLRLRIFRMNVSGGEDGKSALDSFTDLSKEARANFYKENAHKFKHELRSEIETVVKQTSTSSVEFGWVGIGDLMYSLDLA
jgi:hypothetical protein